MYDGGMATTRKAPAAPPPPPPLRDVVAANLRSVIAAKQVKVHELAATMGRPRQWVHRRTFAQQPITTDDIDLFAAALGVTTDELTRRPTPPTA